MILNVINRDELRAFLVRCEAEYGLPEGLAVQALERPLLRRRACLNELKRFPQNAPPWLTRERHSKERFYCFSEKKLMRNDRLRCDMQIVLEWLKTCVEEQAPWLPARLPDGRRRKLINLGRLEHLINAVRKDRAKRAARSEGRPLTGPDTRFVQLGQVETVLVLEGSWRWVRLMDEQAFIHEGVMMRNCVGSPSHNAELLKDRSLYSLRDTKNRPRINLSIVSGYVGQCRGRCNSIPAPRYRTAIRQLLKAFGWRHGSRNTKL